MTQTCLLVALFVGGIPTPSLSTQVVGQPSIDTFDTSKWGRISSKVETLKLNGKSLKVVIQRLDPEVRLFQFERRVSQISAGVSLFRRPLDKELAYTKIGRIGQKIVSALLKVPGVKSVGLRPREIEVEIGKAFFWTVVEPKVLETFRLGLLGEAQLKSYPQSESVCIVVEEVPNEQIRVFHTNRILSEKRIYNQKSLFGEDSRLQDFTQLGETGRKLVVQLENIEGVEDFFLEPYHLNIALVAGHAWTLNLIKQISDLIVATVTEKTVSLNRH